MGIREEDIGLINKYRDSDIPFIHLNDNEPYFTKKEIEWGLLEKPYERYSILDDLNRCRGAFACIIGNKLEYKPNHNRRIKPTAWKSIKCKDIEDGEYLYNRCHLIGRQLSTKKTNRRGLLTGTRNFNIKGMSKFENKVAEYIKKYQDQPVLYRVTPYFKGKNLLAYGVKMEAFSVKDNGMGVSYNVFVYNRQPQFDIDYKKGEVYSNNCMFLEGNLKPWNVYVLDSDTKRFHIASCISICNLKRTNEMYFVGEVQTLIENGCSERETCNTEIK